MSEQPDLNTEEDGAEDQDNELIKSLRAQVREAKAAAKAAAAASESALVEARAQLERESAAQQLVDAAGYPGLTEIVLEKVEGQPTRENVKAALEALSLPVNQAFVEGGAAAQPTAGSAPGSSTPESIAATASLGARVAAAAQSNPEDNAIAALANAQNMAELVAAAQKAGIHDPS